MTFRHTRGAACKTRNRDYQISDCAGSGVTGGWIWDRVVKFWIYRRIDSQSWWHGRANYHHLQPQNHRQHDAYTPGYHDGCMCLVGHCTRVLKAFPLSTVYYSASHQWELLLAASTSLNWKINSSGEGITMSFTLIARSYRRMRC